MPVVFNAEDWSFAVGCAHFGFSVLPPRGYTYYDYCAELQSTLKKVRGLSNLETLFHEDMLDQQTNFDVLEDNTPTDVEEGQDAFPMSFGGEISFDLEIDPQDQDPWVHAPFEPLSEGRFRVYINHKDTVPIALIHPLREPFDANERDDLHPPYLSFAIVLNYLIQEIGRLSSRIALQTLGPTPLPVNFYMGILCSDEPEVGNSRVAGGLVESTADSDRGLRKLVRSQRSFESMYFWFNNKYGESFSRSSLRDSTEFKDFLFDLTEELDVYYHAARIDRLLLKDWEALHELAAKIAHIEQNTKVSDRIRQAPKHRHMLGQIFSGVARIQAIKILEGGLLQEDYNETYRAMRRSALLQDLVDQKVQNIPEYATDQVIELARISETRRLSAVQVWAVILSALGGGAVGAIATSLLQGFL